MNLAVSCRHRSKHEHAVASSGCHALESLERIEPLNLCADRLTVAAAMNEHSICVMKGFLLTVPLALHCILALVEQSGMQ